MSPPEESIMATLYSVTRRLISSGSIHVKVIELLPVVLVKFCTRPTVLVYQMPQFAHEACSKTIIVGWSHSNLEQSQLYFDNYLRGYIGVFTDQWIW